MQRRLLYYNELLAKRLGGRLEVVYEYSHTITKTSKIRIDIETDGYVIEGGKDKRSSLDSVQQAVFASILSGKKLAIAIYDTVGIRYIWIFKGQVIEK